MPPWASWNGGPVPTDDVEIVWAANVKVRKGSPTVIQPAMLTVERAVVIRSAITPRKSPSPAKDRTGCPELPFPR